MKRHPKSSLPLAVVVATLGSALCAQTPAPASAPTDVVSLPEFSVSTTAPSEYTSAESITGTRVATKIRDLPFTVNTVTADFLDDFAAFEFRDQFGYTSSVSVWETLSTGYSLRGFDANVQLRNGFRRIGLIDKVNVERAEVIKGPAASIYGTVLPGGTINVITKKPQTKPGQRVAVSLGANDLRRAQVSSTGPLGSAKWLYRIDAAWDESDYDQAFKHRETRTAAAQVMWKPAPTTSLSLEFEYLERKETGLSSATVPFRIQTGVLDPYRQQPTSGTARTYTRYVGIATEIFDFNTQGPLNFSNRDVYNLTATFEHRINDHFSLRSGANWFQRGLERQEVGGRDQFNPLTRTVPRGTPRLRPFPEGGASWQTDLLASWETGPVKHKTLLTVDYQRQTEQPERWDMKTDAASLAIGMPGITSVSVDNPNYTFVSYYDNPSIYTLAQKERNSIDLYGIFASERATFWDGRANIMTGVRYDYVDNHSRDLRAGTTSERQTDEVSYQLGVNVRLLPAVTAFANFSRSFVPQFSVGNNVDGSTYELPNEFGEGSEVGLKAGFLDNRLSFTATVYEITRTNVARDTLDTTTGAAITVLSGEEKSTGYELDFNYVATPELQFFGGYGNNRTETVSNAQARHLEGSPLRRSPRDNLGLGAKYEFKSGTFKGLFATAGYKYYGRSIANPSTGRNITKASVTAANPFVNNPMPNGLLPFPQYAAGAVLTSVPSDVRVDDGRESVFNRAYDVVEAGLGYKWRSADRRYAHKVQANMSNLWDVRYTYGSTGQGLGRSYTLTYDLNF